MSHSWRVYGNAIDDPKLMGLTDQQFRTWFNLRCLCSANGGVLPPAAVAGSKLRITPDEAKQIVAELAALDLIDIATDGSATMRPLRKLRSDLSTPRVRRFRKRQRDVSSTVSKRSPDAVTRAAQAPTPSPDGRAPSPGNIDDEPFKRDDRLLVASQVMNFAEPNARVRRVRVTNGLDVPFTDRYDDLPITIPPGASESIDLDMAAHFFGSSFDPPAMFRHISKRQGWNTPKYLERNVDGQTLAEQMFAKLKIEPVLYKMVEEEADPDQPI